MTASWTWMHLMSVLFAKKMLCQMSPSKWKFVDYEKLIFINKSPAYDDPDWEQSMLITIT